MYKASVMATGSHNRWRWRRCARQAPYTCRYMHASLRFWNQNHERACSRCRMGRASHINHCVTPHPGGGDPNCGDATAPACEVRGIVSGLPWYAQPWAPCTLFIKASLVRMFGNRCRDRCREMGSLGPLASRGGRFRRAGWAGRHRCDEAPHVLAKACGLNMINSCHGNTHGTAAAAPPGVVDVASLRSVTPDASRPMARYRP